MEIVLGSFSFSSKFECGNLAKVLPIHLPGTASISTPGHKVLKCSSHRGSDSNQVDYEFNLWTKPDCGGTEYENNNRTWFCFNIKGGSSGEKVQLSVMNLNKQSKLYSQGMQPVVKCVGENVQSSNWERIKEKCLYRSEDNSTVITWIHTVPPENRATYYAFTYPYTYTQLQNFLSTLDQRFLVDASDMYYYRELLTYSLDGSRLDLVTVTSQLGKLEEREDRLSGLFPDWNCPRPYNFEGKKVVLVSARVHPGETPSSFVLNGFVNFIVSSDPRAKKLRDIFIFKIIPMLNPDGVMRGHYRTDQRGVNLNRVYNDPSPDLHPTIYAAKKLILYYHHKSSIETILNVQDEGVVSTFTTSTITVEKSTPTLLDEDTCHSFSDAVINKSKTSIQSKPQSVLDADEPSVSGWDCSSNQSADSICRAGFIQNTWDDIQEESNKFYSSGETGVTSMFGSMSPLKDFKILSKEQFKTPTKNTSCLDMDSSSCNLSNISNSPDYILGREQHHQEDQSSESKPSIYLFRPSQGKESAPLSISSPISLSKLGSIRSPAFTLSPSSVLNDSKSNLFMYMDLHGHASKRGIFMYGNWFENPVLMVENMLYPKLLSVNCSNFDFGACNFTERNMYHRDRRDGMSKEGSGRVSVMRATGLIRSYTLECNYNTGRHLGPIPSQNPQARPLGVHGLPPKYTPPLFEDCGNKLGISLYDLLECSECPQAVTSATMNLNALRTELYNSLASTSISPRTSNLSSCVIPGSSPSPKLGSIKNTKDFKPSTEEKNRDRTPTTKPKAVTLSKVIAPVGSSFPQKLTSLHAFGGGRRQSLSSMVDAENQEPQTQRTRTTKAKTLKAKKDVCGMDAAQVKSKKFRYKSASSKKMSSSQSLLYKEMGEASHFSSTEKLSSPQHNLASSVRLPSDVNFKTSLSDKSESSKLMKKIEKGRKPRTKTIKFGSKKFKNLSGSNSPPGTFKSDQFGKNPLKESDEIGGPLTIDSCCLSPPNPLSPRSPLASMFEAQTSQPTPVSSLNLKQKNTSFVSGTKATFHSCPKRQPKTLKSIPSCSDRFPVVPPTTGQRLKLFPKKVKKKASNTGEITGKMLSKPTTSQAPLQWVMRKPLKLSGELETSSSLSTRVVKKRKKTARKSI